MPLSLLMLVGGIGLLVLGADWLIDGAKAAALRLGISPFVVGLTVLAFGTSAPEMAACVGMAVKGHGETAVGAVVGSNIANIALILGLCAVLKPIPVRGHAPRTDAGIVLFTTVAAMVLFRGRRIERWEAGVLVVGLAWYIARAYFGGRRVGGALGAERPVGPGWLASAGLIAFGAAGLAVGSQLLVNGAKSIAVSLGVPEFIVGLTLVAFGTSLPELVTSVRAAMRDEPEMAIGNVLGSNVFNLFGVLGVAGLVRPLGVAPGVLARDAWVMLALSVLVLPMFRPGRRITRAEGLALVIGYLAYVGALFGLA